jgi:hypothetical protein
MARLDDATLSHAVLKCVHSGVPLCGLDGLDDRITPGITRMLAGYAHERIVAGRSVTADIWPVVDRFPPHRELAAIEAELGHPVAARRQAAAAALAARAACAATRRKLE